MYVYMITDYTSIVGYPDYVVSKDGVFRIKGKSSLTFHKIKPVRTGTYDCLLLYNNGKRKRFYLHRLLAEYFVPNPYNKPEVNHKDGNKLNNDINNLEWVTSSENKYHAVNLGLTVSLKGESHPSTKFGDDVVMEVRKLWNNRKENKLRQHQIGELFGISQQHISQLVNNVNRN